MVSTKAQGRDCDNQGVDCDHSEQIFLGMYIYITDIVIPGTVSTIEENAFGVYYDINKTDSFVLWVPKVRKDFYSNLLTSQTGFTDNMIIRELEN